MSFPLSIDMVPFSLAEVIHDGNELVPLQHVPLPVNPREWK
jgi:hypothetical protein